MTPDHIEASHRDGLEDWSQDQTDFVHGLPPQLALQISGETLLKLLEERLGKIVFNRCLDPKSQVESIVAEQNTTDWIKHTNMVGINVRTIGDHWSILKYQLCLPTHVSAIHLLPIWEPGVVSSLYGMASWRLNGEFFSEELYQLQPQLDGVEKQLKVVINFLHALGKTVGMDVIPHTDRYSEIVLANPSYFEWLRRDDKLIVDHSANLYQRVEESILLWLQSVGSADGSFVPLDTQLFFVEQSEEERLKALFGKYLSLNPSPSERGRGRGDLRRASLIDHLYRQGLEPVPATMAPPYRGLEVDPNPEAVTVDQAGRVWRDYRIKESTEMSRVFGPLARYQLYERKDDNRNWEIDFERPKPNVWSYVAEKYATVQQEYGFDFMRGDMSHVQMRPQGTPDEPDEYYDLLAFVKQHIQKSTPYFAYYAESFLAPDNYMGYGNEVAHLEASQAEVALGNLQSMVPGSETFLYELDRYRRISDTSSLKPCFTVITSDKDDPRFDKFYTRALAARMFSALLLTDWPSYYSLGVEQRDTKYQPWPNEYYTKLYVFHLESGPKSRHGPYRWGSNSELFYRLDRLHQFVSGIWANVRDQTIRWLVPPSPISGYALLVWLIGSDYLCAVNFGETPAGYQGKLAGLTDGKWQVVFSLMEDLPLDAEVDITNEITIPLLAGGSGVMWSRNS
ncbi:MAG: hypothetical protein AAF741_00855 [Bacteroidota bacterium]